MLDGHRKKPTDKWGQNVTRALLTAARYRCRWLALFKQVIDPARFGHLVAIGCCMGFLQELLRRSNDAAGDGSAHAQDQKAPKKDARYHGRSKIACPVTLSWTDADGATRKASLRGIDMSGTGVCVESPKPVAPGSRVYVQVKQLKLMGIGVVRHCAPRGSKFRIGLEFPNPLTPTF